MGKCKDRIGEVSYNSKGEKMTIVAYRSYSDIDVQFEDGYIKRGVRYNNFQKGTVSRGKVIEESGIKGVVEEVVSKEGYKVKIIRYESNNDIDVEFPNGYIKEGVDYVSFKEGRIKIYPLGGESRTRNGNKITIIRYRDNSSMTVRLDSGEEFSGVSLKDFRTGDIKDKVARVGEYVLLKDGSKGVIIEYRGNDDIDVQLDDGRILRSTNYKYFRKRIGIKERLGLGDIRKNIEGEDVKVVSYKTRANIDVEFSGGFIKQSVSYADFQSGLIVRDPLGKVVRNNKGERLTIIRYTNDSKMDVRYDDGDEVKGVSYKDFISGTITRCVSAKTNAGSPRYAQKRKGEMKENLDGIMMKIVAYRAYNDIDVRFETGELVRGVTYDQFKRGVLSPDARTGNRVVKLAKERVGEQNFNKFGDLMWITEYRGCNDIDVKFADGRVRKGVSYRKFVNGTLD